MIMIDIVSLEVKVLEVNMYSGLMNFNLSCLDIPQNIYMNLGTGDLFDVPYISVEGLNNHVYWTFVRPYNIIIENSPQYTSPIWINIYYSVNISNGPQNIFEFVYTPLKDIGSFNINTPKRSYFISPPNLIFDTIYTTKNSFKIDPNDVVNNNIFAIGVAVSGNDGIYGNWKIHGASIWYSGMIGKFENNIP